MSFERIENLRDLSSGKCENDRRGKGPLLTNKVYGVSIVNLVMSPSTHPVVGSRHHWPVI